MDNDEQQPKIIQVNMDMFLPAHNKADLNNTGERNSSKKSNYKVERVASPPQGWTMFFDDENRISKSKQSQQKNRILNTNEVKFDKVILRKSNSLSQYQSASKIQNQKMEKQ